nr:hypothetical protein [Tanacetum cinerariifolium]
MSKDPSIPRRNKVNMHYVRDDHMNSNAYKEYYAIATGAAPPKPKASVRMTKSSSDTSITPPTTATSPKLTASVKGKQTAKASKAKSLSALSEVAMTEAQQLKLVTKRSMQQTHISQASGSGVDEGIGNDDDDDDDQEIERDDDKDDEEEGGDEEEIKREYGEDEYDEETKDEESFDPISQTPKNSEDKGNGAEDLGLNVGGKERNFEEEEEDELYRDVNINQGRGIKATLEVEDSFMTLTPVNPDVKVAIQIQSDRLHDEAQRENDEFLKTVDENMQKIIKEQVKEQVKALIEAYESDKIILDTYGETITLKRRRDNDADKDEEPSTGPDRGSKRCREGKEPESVSAPTEIATRSAGRSIQLWISELAKQADSRSSFNELMDNLLDFSNFLINRLKVDTLTPKLLARPTYELMKGSCKSLVELEYHLEEVFKATIDQLDWVNLEGQQYPHNLLQPLPLIPNNRGCRVIPFEYFINDLEYLRREWHSYKHLDWIMVRRDDDKLYKFKEGDFKRLRIQDIKDMLLLLVQRKLSNLTIKERFAFNVSLRMFTRSIVIQRRVEDLQLGVKSYQKKLNLTKLDLYRSDLKLKEADRTLTDVRTALDDRLKGIRMKYLPQSIWRKRDKDRAAAMIQAIDKRLKTRRIMRSLEKFVGGRLYEGDFRMLQRTI